MAVTTRARYKSLVNKTGNAVGDARPGDDSARFARRTARSFIRFAFQTAADLARPPAEQRQLTK